MSDKYLEELALPPVMALPAMPDGDEDLLQWARELHVILQNTYIPQADRVENLNMMDEGTSRRPATKGTRRFFYDAQNDILSFDILSFGAAGAEWRSVGGAGAFLPLTGGTITGDLDLDGDLLLANNKYLQGEETDTTARNLVGVSSGDVIVVGDTAIDMIIQADVNVDISGANLRLDNNARLLAEIAASGTWRDLIYLDTSNRAVVGNTSADTLIKGGGTYEVKIDGGELWIGDGAYLNDNAGTILDISNSDNSSHIRFIPGAGSEIIFGQSGGGCNTLMRNNFFMQWEDTGAADIALLHFDSSNVFRVGDSVDATPQYDTHIYGNDIVFKYDATGSAHALYNDTYPFYFYAKNTGGTNRLILGLFNSPAYGTNDDIVLGDTNERVYIRGSQSLPRYGEPNVDRWILCSGYCVLRDNGGGQPIGVVWTDIIWDTQITVSSSWYTHTNGTAIIEFDEAGSYLALVDVGLDNSNAADRHAHYRIVRDSGGGYVEIDGFQTCSHHPGAAADGHACAHISAYLQNMGAGDKIKVQVIASNANSLTTVADNCRITIIRMSLTE